MDLKSMLNDSSVHKPPPPSAPPRLHTPQSSFDQAAAVQTPAYDHPSQRNHAYQPPPHSSHPRSPPSAGYFGVQSPHPQQNSAFTPGVREHLVSAQSPGPHGKPYTPREGAIPQNPYHAHYAPSPSPHPATPGSAHHHHQYNSPQGAAFTHPTGPPGPIHRQFTRDEVGYTNGNPQGQQRHLSPAAPLHAPPATPLGPPASYQRPSPHAQRPLSQGYENYRRSSFGSVGSTHSRDHTIAHSGPPDPAPRNSVHRTYSGDDDRHKERERSLESVSPKTIPKPPPLRQTSTGVTHDSGSEAPSAPPPQSIQSQPRSAHATPDRHVDGYNLISTPKSSAPSAEPRATSHFSSARPSPVPAAASSMTPQSTHSSLPAQPSPPVSKQPSLKRNASVISSSSVSTMPPRKRLRRDEIPIFAQSARRGRPLRLGRGGPVPRPVRKDAPVKKEQDENRGVNGHTAANMTPGPQPEPGWEPSITNLVPYEDLTRRVCDWIVATIGLATPPSGGAMFEIEAKIGAIVEVDDDARLRLPVTTETIFQKDGWRRTKFESTMDMAQHKQLNTFLNNLVQQSFAEAQTSNREVIRPSHPKESDEFFDLTSEGRKNLPQSIAHWLNPRHTPRVRRTIDTTTGQLKSQIIKSRIADLDIFNPGADFDYRISISIESPWDGEPHHLTEMTDAGGRDRRKDRMSYRHLAYQIDLTQVTYANSNKREHELEVEISTEQIRLELDNLRAQRPSRYEDLVRGFIDNVRILCRKGTVARHGG